MIEVFMSYISINRIDKTNLTNHLFRSCKEIGIMNFNIIISLHSFHTFLITNLKKKYSSKYEKSWNTNRLKLFFLKKFNLISNFIQTYLLRLLDNCPDIKSYNRCELEIFNILCNNNYYKIARNIVFIVINRIRRLEREYVYLVKSSKTAYRLSILKRSYMGLIFKGLKKLIPICKYLKNVYSFSLNLDGHSKCNSAVSIFDLSMTHEDNYKSFTASRNLSKRSKFGSFKLFIVGEDLAFVFYSRISIWKTLRKIKTCWVIAIIKTIYLYSKIVILIDCCTMSKEIVIFNSMIKNFLNSVCASFKKYIYFNQIHSVSLISIKNMLILFVICPNSRRFTGNLKTSGIYFKI